MLVTSWREIWDNAACEVLPLGYVTNVVCPFPRKICCCYRRCVCTVVTLSGQVGAFPHYGGRWAEWNGGFRDTVRQFIKGSEGPWAAAFAQSVCGSPNLYGTEQPVRTQSHLICP